MLNKSWWLFFQFVSAVYNIVVSYLTMYASVKAFASHVEVLCEMLRNRWSEWHEMKRKCIGCVDLSHHIDFGFYKVNFEITVSQELLVILMWIEKEADQLDTGLIMWPCPLIIHMTWTLEVWNSLISWMGGLIDMERKGCESTIHDHDGDFGWLWLGEWIVARCDF